MRDRLIELLREAKEHPEKTCPRWELPTCGGCDYNKGDECDQIARLADFLLKNGVIAPPCKVGDTVYEAVFFKKGVFSHWVASKVVGFHLGDFPTLRGQKRKQYIVVWHSFPNCICHIPLDNFGKSVFFKHQLEDAEKRLKEGADNG